MKPSRKQKKNPMSIPQLRKAFDHIEMYTASLLAGEKDTSKRRKAFQAEWMKVFHRPVDDKAADAYLQFESKKKKTMKRKGQRGGAALGGAPLDSSTRPGIYGVYGEFPQYISGGFATFADSTNKMAIQEGCNSAAEAAKFQAPYTGFGAPSLALKGGGSKKSRKQKKGKTRKMKGGANWGEFASAMSLRPLTASAPPSQLYTNLMEWKGGEAYPSSLANTGAPAYQSLRPQVQVATAGAITRDLASEL